MTIINLRDFFYWYIIDEFIEVTDDVAEVLRSDKRYEITNHRRLKRNKANYSLDAGDCIENQIVEFAPSVMELLDRKNRFIRLCYALNSLPTLQGRRIEAHFLLGKSVKEIAINEGVSVRAVQISIKQGLKNMRNYLKKF